MTRQRTTRLLAAPVAAAVMFAGIGLAPATANEPRPAPSSASIIAVEERDADQDGKDLFRAVFFFQGEIADELMRDGILTADAQVRELNRSAEGTQAIDLVVETLEQADPDFFPTFSAQLRSGDPFQVEAGLQAATDLLTESLPTMTRGDEAAALIVMAVVVVVVAAALVVSVGAVYSMTYGGLIHQAVAINKNAVFASTMPRGGRDLDVERHVAAVTKALATAGTGGGR